MMPLWANYVGNPNKLTPLNGASLFGKKKQKKTCEALLCQTIIWCCSFSFAYVSSEMASNKEMKLKWFQ